MREPAECVLLVSLAGVHHGPLYNMHNSYILRTFHTDSSRELFELCDPLSDVSASYAASLLRIVSMGARVFAVGAWRDLQVVPLYSALMHGFMHPNIKSVVYIDAGHLESDFLLNLVLYLTSMHNRGVYDRTLLVHRSRVCHW